MIKLRPWKGSKNEFEADIIVFGPNGRTLRKRVKAPVAGKSNAERWARSLEQELLAQLLAPAPEPEKPLAPTFEVFAVLFMDLCKANRLGKNTLMNYDIHLRLYLLPVLGKRRLDEVKPADLTALKASLATKARSTMTEVLKSLRRLFTVAIEQGLIAREPVKLDIPARIHKSPIAYDDADQQALLAAAQALGPEYVAMVLLGIDGELRRGDIKRWMQQLVEKGNLTWHGTHVLRKTCGTRIADGGGGVSAVASHLRHKSLQTASRYIDRRGAGSRALNALES